MTETVDLCERAADALRAGGVDATTKRIDRLSGKDGTVVRMMPPRTRATYFDGSRRIDYTLQVISKSLDPMEAMATCERATEVLRAADLASANGSYEALAQAEPDGDVEEVAVGADMRHVWCARLTVQTIRQ